MSKEEIHSVGKGVWTGDPSPGPEAGHCTMPHGGQTPCVAWARSHARPTHSGVVPTSGSEDGRWCKREGCNLGAHGPAGLGTVDVRLASSGLSDPLGVSDYSGRNLKRETLGFLPKYACWCVRD